MTELVVRENQNQPTIFDGTPAGRVKVASEIAKVLADVIKQQHLWVQIGPNKYVKAEGWATLGTLLGILPREERVIEHKNGDYEAFVHLIRQSDGVVMGGASALCGIDEKRWSGADRYARRSMAITRATGKAYRLGFAWVISLAGYSPTPAEEIPYDDDVEPSTPKAARPVEKPVSPICYDNKNRVDRLWMAEELRKAEVPQELKNSVAEAFHGSPRGAIGDHIRNYREAQT